LPTGVRDPRRGVQGEGGRRLKREKSGTGGEFIRVDVSTPVQKKRQLVSNAGTPLSSQEGWEN